jgi:hypothetical protein
VLKERPYACGTDIARSDVLVMIHREPQAERESLRWTITTCWRPSSASTRSTSCATPSSPSMQ